MFSNENLSKQPHASRHPLIEHGEVRVVGFEAETHHQLANNIVDMPSKEMCGIHSLSFSVF